MLSTNVRLEDDAVSEIHFQIEGPGHQGNRLVAQVGRTIATLGRAEGPPKPGPESTFESTGPNLSIDPDRETHHVQIEKQANDWWVTIDGQLLGTAPLTTSVMNNDFALSVVQGNAAFSEIDARELKLIDPIE